MGQGTEGSQMADVISVFLPPDERYVHLLRLTVSGIGLRMDLTYDDVEDLKLAVNEAFLLAIGHSRDERVGVDFQMSGDSAEVLFRSVGDLAEHAEGDDHESLGLFLIKGVMDEVEFETSNEETSLRMVKKLAKEKV